jgi:hypothetical protein
MGATIIMAMLNMNIRQSVAYDLAGMAINVIALRVVAKMLMPAAHQGIRPPALKKSSVLFSRRMKKNPSSNMPIK